MNNPKLFSLVSAVLFTISTGAMSHDSSAMQTASAVFTDRSKAQCAIEAHRACNMLFGECATDSSAALGYSEDIHSMFQCHRVNLDTGGTITIMVISGLRYESQSRTLNRYMQRALDLATSGMK